MSAHADADEIIGWLRRFDAPPRAVHIVHGEPAASAALCARVVGELGWNASVAERGATVEV
jgi:metallo-beta-lactamase family protein